MHRVRIKICGITDAAGVEAAVNAGADAVGFVMSESPRQLNAESVRSLMQLLPPWVASVIVTRHPGADFAAKVIADLRPHWWQSDAADLAGLIMPKGTRALPVVRQSDDIDELPDAYVYEGTTSGAGQTVDWAVAARHAKRSRMILAGGLAPDNVAAAIESVRPWAVDVSSGVEAERGKKDTALIAAFTAAVFATDTR